MAYNYIYQNGNLTKDGNAVPITALGDDINILAKILGAAGRTVNPEADTQQMLNNVPGNQATFEDLQKLRAIMEIIQAEKIGNPVQR